MKKVEYIWTYYKIQILAAMMVVFLAGYFIFNASEDKVATILHVSFVNYYNELSENSQFYQGFVEAYPINEKEEKVEFDTYNFFDLGKSSEFSNSYYQKIVAYLEAGTTDGIICEYDNLMGIGMSGRVLDLRDSRLGDLYEKYKDLIVYITVEEEEIPIGIDISKNQILSNESGYANSIYLGISTKIKNIEQIKNLLEYLLL